MTTHGLTLVGESYAGTYIPSVARGIYLNNVANAPNVDGSERLRVPLAGIAIRLHLKVIGVREATLDEIGTGTCGSGFFKLQSDSGYMPGNDTVH